MTLIAGFSALSISTDHKISSSILLAMLTVWSFGLGLVLYFFKTAISRFAMPIIWATTLLSTIFLISNYGRWLAIYSIPISLLFCYFRMTSGNPKNTCYLPLIINLFYCGILCLFCLKMGLLK
ncbi:hypothetical protein C4F49_16845 [Sphingobacterium sp. KB22]|uniref:Uncharacterized protein n=1 Tax=Sphingobacterium hungaricum TaxID=2082723 RepID=A0A928UYH2_9SPHI|nr:hypothetical protein [Sphingobacterium hungaricum]